MKRALAGCSVFAAAALSCLVAAPPASAEFTENTVGCAGSAVITDNDGETFAVDAEDAEVVVPRTGAAQWEGSVATVTHNHRGEVVLEVGPLDVALGSWGTSENANDESSSSGTKELPSTLEQVPSGKYEVSGFHRGDEGGCAGGVTVEIDGSPFDTIAGIANAALAALTAALMVVAMFASSAKPAFRGRPVLGAIAGLLFGAFLGIELVFLKAMSSGSPLLMILPLVFLVVGVAAALAAPFGRGRAGAPNAGAPPAAPAPPT